MQKLALFFLFAIMISLVAPFESVLAQETPNEEMTEEDTMEDEMAEEETMDEGTMEEMVEDEMMDDTMEEEMEETEHVDPPLKQMAMGIEPHEIQCKSGQKLVFKASNWRPACVNESSFDILAQRGWVSNHDPTHEELTKMIDDYMATLPEEPEEEIEEETEEEVDQEEIEIEEEVSVEEEADTGSSNETEAEPQSYSIDLRESMDMGAQ